MTEIIPITNQEVIDKAYKWFVIDKHSQARDEKFNCVYKLDDNTKCAIGCLIPDELYSSKLEDAGIGSLIQSSFEDVSRSIYVPIRQFFGGCNLEMLEKLQSIHDGWDGSLRVSDPYYTTFDQHMRQGILEICELYDLVFPGNPNLISDEVIDANHNSSS